MSAIVIILPVIWAERCPSEAERETEMLRVLLAEMVTDAPPRTRPVLVVDNEAELTPAASPSTDAKNR